MAIDPTLANVSWYAAGLAVLVVLDLLAWTWALHLLPASRRATILRLLSWLWAVIPLAALLVIVFRENLIHQVKLHALWFEDAVAPEGGQQSLLAGPAWNLPSWWLDCGTLYLFTGPGLLAVLAIVWVPNDKLPGTWDWFRLMAVVPIALMAYCTVVLHG